MMNNGSTIAALGGNLSVSRIFFLEGSPRAIPLIEV